MATATTATNHKKMMATDHDNDGDMEDNVGHSNDGPSEMHVGGKEQTTTGRHCLWPSQLSPSLSWFVAIIVCGRRCFLTLCNNMASIPH